MIRDTIENKNLKAKEKVAMLARGLVGGEVSLKELLLYAKQSKDPAKGICIEALEFATKTNPDIITKVCFTFLNDSLASPTPKIKWESARVIGNVCSLHRSTLEPCIKNLLMNTSHEGTVVRWSMAYALAEIMKLKTIHNNKLVPAVKQIYLTEKENSILKIYSKALKHIGAL